MLPSDGWEYFTGCPSRTVANLLTQKLEAEGVPCQVVSRELESGVDLEYWVVVRSELAHRARWVVAQDTFEEEELAFLATGMLGSTEDQ
jgi:hypothetical protein